MTSDAIAHPALMFLPSFHPFADKVRQVHNNSRDAKSPNFFPYNFFPPALNCDAIDVITVHGFSGEWASETCTPSYLNGAAKQKYMMIEEFGLGRNGSSSFDKQSRLFNDAGIPWVCLLSVLLRVCLTCNELSLNQRSFIGKWCLDLTRIKAVVVTVCVVRIPTIRRRRFRMAGMVSR